MNIKKEIWLFISGFGIMFAVLSWIQESQLLLLETGSLKGFIAVISGFILYLLFRKSL